MRTMDPIWIGTHVWLMATIILFSVLLAMRAMPAKLMNERIRNRNQQEIVFEFDEKK
jgi:protein-S-isoprenylcysteine O-methyltransferase Ste14